MLKEIKKNGFMQVMRFMEKRLPLYLITTIIDAAIVSVCLNIVLAFISKNVFNAAVKGDINLIINGITIAGVSFLIGATLRPFRGYISKKCVRQTMTDIRVKVYKSLCNSDLQSLEKYHSGDLTSRIINDMGSIEDIYASQVFNLAFACVNGIIAVAAIFMLQWILGIIVLILGIITLLVCKKFNHTTKEISDTIQQQTGTMNERLVDIIQGITVTKIFSLEDIVQHFYSEKNHELCKNMFKRDCINGKFLSVNFLFSFANEIGVLCIGVFMAMNRMIDMGTIIAVILLQDNANYMFNNINSFMINIQKSLAGANRVTELLDLPMEADTLNINNNSQKSNTQGAVSIKEIKFSYEDKYKGNAVPILNKISFSVDKGETAALVGKSGCGKSTVIKLLLGFYKADEGSICINGKPLNEYKLNELRNLMAYVPQNAYLFSGTVEENIGFGIPNASEDEIIAAAKAANAHDFIMELPHGYETQVGEMGGSLSGGQRQRIAIARALLKNSPILLLDEATSALDAESEQLVQQALETLMKGRTTIMVAHKLSSIKEADIIYVMDNGKIIEKSSHDALIRNHGIYKRMYELAQ
jgi:ATP-binding cassette, subfamily B, bacterial